MEYYTTIGIDVGDKTSKICVMKKEGGERLTVAEATCATTAEGFAEALEGFDRSALVVFETGTHCRWMKAHVESLGFRVLVANPCKVRLITRSSTKNDANDARELARLALADPALLHPVTLRDEECQRMLRHHAAREQLVKSRTQIINLLRGFAKSMGYRIDPCAADRFHLLSRAGWPKELAELAGPLMKVLEETADKIKLFERMIADLAATPAFKDKVERCREVVGVGLLGASRFVATIGGDAGRFARARDVGPYLGLVPRQDQSGETDRQLHITKQGSAAMRRLLLECANVAMKSNVKDTDVKLKGLRICQRGGGIAKRRALCAVARQLAVLMTALLKHPERKYVPLSDKARGELSRLRGEDVEVSA